MKNSYGFSLLELAVVLVIGGIIVTMGMSLGNNAMMTANRFNTGQRLATVQAALESFAEANGFLPCPADRTQTLSGNGVSFGVESRITGTPTCVITSPGVVNADGVAVTGMVPVRTLGLPDIYAADAWGNKFTYSVSNNLTQSPLSYTTMLPQIIIRTGDRSGVYSTLTSTNSRPSYADSSAITPGAGAAYVVVSHGPDGRGAYPYSASVILKPCGTDIQNDTVNCSDRAVFWDTAYSDNPALPDQYFDDFIVWGSNMQKLSSNVPSPGGCPGSRCEAWCAPCVGAPANMPQAAPSSLTGAPSPILCQKILTSSAPQACAATCIWAGVSAINSNVVITCP